MTRSISGGFRPSMIVALLALHLALVTAGPVGPLPNVTSLDLGLKEGSCALGDVVYLEGDEFPGTSPCERCRCARGEVQCATQQCQSRPGCKAVHRPDHCCPTYQCECEQDGHVYGNGEKLVDPQDPCRVCYCQGGEVVCRRIACFVRDDCRPRRTPGRCCPEYDNCPLTGVSTISGLVQSMSTSIIAETSPQPHEPKKMVKQEITIKEITPVSEIPALNDVKVKEILSSDIAVPEYPSSKSPPIVREATSEKAEIEIADASAEVAQPSSSSSITFPSEATQSVTIMETTKIIDALPSKISLSTQDFIQSKTNPSMSSSSTFQLVPVAITKAPIIEEEDITVFEHNPAFPPLPDDLSVLSNHEDELSPEPSPEIEHAPVTEARTTNPPTTHVVTTPQPITTTAKVMITTKLATTTIEPVKTSPEVTTYDKNTTTHSKALSTEVPILKESPMLNLRSAIPTEILNLPSLIQEDITGQFNEFTTEETDYVSTSNTQQPDTMKPGKTTQESELSTQVSYTTYLATTDDETTDESKMTVFTSTSQARQETTSSIAKSHIATDITAQTEVSSLPIETSDQNPQQSEHTSSENVLTTTERPTVGYTGSVQFSTEFATTKVPVSIKPEVITVAKQEPSTTENQSFENVETTEFVLSLLGSSESATDIVELIRISAEPGKSAPIIEFTKKNNVLKDLINLVGDVAELGSRDTNGPDRTRATTEVSGYSDSDELIPVNAGYKSKNSNWNLNSITEIPGKTKTSTATTETRQKVIEIEGEDTDSITDAAPPHDRVEPTTRRPIIDHVSDDRPASMPSNGTDFEIITRSYVPSIYRRPTKVVMKKNSERAGEEQSTTENAIEMFSENVTDTTSDEIHSEEPTSSPTQ